MKRLKISKIGHLSALFNSIGFKLVSDENYVYLIDIVENQQRGLFVINKTPQTPLMITVPYPITENLASDSAALIFQHLKSKALNKNASNNISKGKPAKPFYQAFINALEAQELLQVRESNRYTAALLKSTPVEVKSQYWIFNRLPASTSQREMHEFIG